MKMMNDEGQIGVFTETVERKRKKIHM